MCGPAFPLHKRERSAPWHARGSYLVNYAVFDDGLGAEEFAGAASLPAHAYRDH